MRAGELPKLSVSLTNTGTTSCTIDAGTAQQVFTITSGSEVYWKSTRLPERTRSDAQVLLQPGKTISSQTPITWDRTRSDPSTCQAGARRRCRPGERRTTCGDGRGHRVGDDAAVHPPVELASRDARCSRTARLRIRASGSERGVEFAVAVAARGAERDAEGLADALAARIDPGAEAEAGRPRRCAACRSSTGRISPARLISPNAASVCGMALVVRRAIAMARAMARSAPGSVRRTPPTVDT